MNRSLQCRSCGSANQQKFIAEVGIRSPGMKNVDKPSLFVFPELMVCLDCGLAGFVLPEEDLHVLAKGILQQG